MQRLPLVILHTTIIALTPIGIIHLTRVYLPPWILVTEQKKKNKPPPLGAVATHLRMRFDRPMSWLPQSMNAATVVRALTDPVVWRYIASFFVELFNRVWYVLAMFQIHLNSHTGEKRKHSHLCCFSCDTQIHLLKHLHVLWKAAVVPSAYYRIWGDMPVFIIHLKSATMIMFPFLKLGLPIWK